MAVLRRCAAGAARVNLVLAAGLGAIGFALALCWQLRTEGYRPVPYWTAVAMLAVFGTMAADAVHVVLGIAYPGSTILYALALVGVLGLWHRSESTLSVHSITNRRRELFYWATVLVTFALGTAAGDLTAIGLGLGYRESIVVFAALMVAVVLARRLGVGEITAFWTAYVLTRPLGASIADWLGKPHEKAGGLGFGDGPVTLVLLALIVALVTWLARTGHGVQRASR